VKQTALRQTAAPLQAWPLGRPQKLSVKQTPDWQTSPVQALLFVRPHRLLVASQTPLKQPRWALVWLQTPPTGLGEGSGCPFGALGEQTPLSVAQNCTLVHSASSKQPAPHEPETGSQ
jgi:hypothetical protein